MLLFMTRETFLRPSFSSLESHKLQKSSSLIFTATTCLAIHSLLSTSSSSQTNVSQYSKSSNEMISHFIQDECKSGFDTPLMTIYSDSNQIHCFYRCQMYKVLVDFIFPFTVIFFVIQKPFIFFCKVSSCRDARVGIILFGMIRNEFKSKKSNLFLTLKINK